MKEYLRLKDEFKIDDSHSKIRGIVVCKTEDGKIIFTKENMIVKDGRKIILKRLLDSNATVPVFYPVSGSEYKMTSPDDKITTRGNLYRSFGSGDPAIAIGRNPFREIKVDSTLPTPTVEEENVIIKVQSEDNLPENSFCINLDELYIHFRLSKDSGGSGSVTSSFGLAVSVPLPEPEETEEESEEEEVSEENTATGYELFSRVTFPSYPDSVNLVFDYYIYF